MIPLPGGRRRLDRMIRFGPMDAPDRQLDPAFQQRVMPSQDMLVDAVD